jgi:hypothetical protein
VDAASDLLCLRPDRVITAGDFGRAGLPSALPADLLVRARELDAAHRAATGRPISRDILRERMRIGRDRAAALVAAVRTEAKAPEPTPGLLRAAL